ncbi:response regulator [Sulfurimonas sp. SAG-AH-194-I05]|nr:response regulator [Sulfurimonas sp. SAG-AH-194-I05]MDF1875120.1 response regulator [Sulfurimonas sp. SAG-AH-194-I05]
MNIIVLDDSFTVRMIIESFLEDLGVHDDEIHSFENALHALEYIEKNGADLIFSDIHMPEMDGYEFATALFKKRKDLQKVFFAISGDETRESYKKMKEIGVHRFLRKPIDSIHFNHFVQQEIEKYRNSENLSTSDTIR